MYQYFLLYSVYILHKLDHKRRTFKWNTHALSHDKMVSRATSIPTLKAVFFHVKKLSAMMLRWKINNIGKCLWENADIPKLVLVGMVVHDEDISVSLQHLKTFSMLAYNMLNYPLKCAPARTAGAHFSGYFINQWLMIEPWFSLLHALSVTYESLAPKYCIAPNKHTCLNKRDFYWPYLRNYWTELIHIFSPWSSGIQGSTLRVSWKSDKG